MSATHFKCSYDSICKDQSNDHQGPLAAIDLCVFLYLTNGRGEVTWKWQMKSTRVKAYTVYSLLVACWRFCQVLFIYLFLDKHVQDMIIHMVMTTEWRPAARTLLTFDQYSPNSRLLGLCTLLTEQTVWGNGAATECWQSLASIPWFHMSERHQSWDFMGKIPQYIFRYVVAVTRCSIVNKALQQ